MAQKVVREVHKNGGGAVYGMGVLGALIYYLFNANGFTEIIFGIIKSLFWPAFLIYKVFESLQI